MMDLGKNDYTDTKKFGEYIRDTRKMHNMSRALVAERLKLSSQSSIMNFETGHTAMRLKHIFAFIRILPFTTIVTLPVFLAMYEANSYTPPCQCICHHDLSESIPDIYDDDSSCRLCHHNADDCELKNGLWFEKTG